MGPDSYDDTIIVYACCTCYLSNCRRCSQILKRIAAFLALVCTALLAGCVRLEMDIVIENNGTIYSAYIFAVRQEGSYGADIEGLMEAAENTARDNGFRTQPYSQEGYKGFKASKRIENTDLNRQGHELLGFDTMPSVFDMVEIERTSGMFEDRYSAELAADLRGIIDSAMLESLPGDIRKAAFEALESSELILSLTMPGKVRSSNADKISEGRGNATYTWKLSPGQVRTLSAVSVHDKQSARSMAYITASVSALLLTALAAAAFVYLNRKRR